MEGFKKYKIDYSGGALYVENIKWNDKGLVVELENENCEKIIHFAIVGVDNIVEVFTSDFPKLYWK